MSRLRTILRHSFACIASGSVVLFGEVAGAQGVCGAPSSGSCCAAQSTAGCADAACCNTVCASDPFCCNTQWDSICADAANTQCAGCFSLTVTNNGCNGTQLSFPLILAATSYVVSYEIQAACINCGFPTDPTTMETVAYTGNFGSNPTSVGLPRTPAFFGRWKVRVLNSFGVTIADLYSTAGVSHPATGAPMTTQAPETRTIDVGTSCVLTATPYQTTANTFQWYRDSVAIPGATGPTYTAFASPFDPASVTYYCLLGNSCGLSVSNTFLINKASCAPILPVQLNSLAETEQLSVLLPIPFNSVCTYTYPALVRHGACDAVFATVGPGTIAVAMTAEYSNNSRRTRSAVANFTVTSNMNLHVDLSGSSAGFSETGTVSLSGPVSYTATGTVFSPVNRTDLLPPGSYTLTVSIQTGNLGCRNCGTCGPSCIQSCDLAAQPRSLTMLATFDPEGPCGDASAGDCCVAHNSPGCADAVCCLGVCALDPFCCNAAWDNLCAGAARTNCTVCDIAGDLNGDGVVNGSDLANLLGAWGTPKGDVDGDGTTNGADLAMLLANWG